MHSYELRIDCYEYPRWREVVATDRWVERVQSAKEW